MVFGSGGPKGRSIKGTQGGTERILGITNLSRRRGCRLVLRSSSGGHLVSDPQESPRAQYPLIKEYDMIRGSLI